MKVLVADFLETMVTNSCLKVVLERCVVRQCTLLQGYSHTQWKGQTLLVTVHCIRMPEMMFQIQAKHIQILDATMKCTVLHFLIML